MFSFAGDTVFDPFMGTATTQAAAAKWGRNSVGVEVEPEYFKACVARMSHEAAHMFSRVEVVPRPGADGSVDPERPGRTP